jgi:hypothetical protein
MILRCEASKDTKQIRLIRGQPKELDQPLDGAPAGVARALLQFTDHAPVQTREAGHISLGPAAPFAHLPQRDAKIGGVRP